MENFFSNLTSILAADVRKNLRGALLARHAFIILDRKGNFAEHFTSSSR
jgi:hypothetical protein